LAETLSAIPVYLLALLEGSPGLRWTHGNSFAKQNRAPLSAARSSI